MMLRSLISACFIFTATAFNLCAADDPFDSLGGLELPDDNEDMKKNAGKFGPAPFDSILIEAEDFKSDNKSWKIRERADEWNRLSGAPSAGKLLDGSGIGKADARHTIKIDKPGEKKLWVRYIDHNEKAKRTNSEFTVSLIQNGKTIASKTFDEKHIARQHDRYFKTDPQWDSLDFKAISGNLEIKITKLNPDTASSGDFGRNIDCFVITSDKAYKPHIFDFHPIFVRVTAMKNQEKPFRFMFCGMPLTKSKKPGKGNDLFKAGEKSEFLYVSEKIKTAIKGGLTVGIPYNPYARGDKTVNRYLVEFSTTPDEKGIFVKLPHDEPGLSFPLFFDPASKKLKTDIDWSLISLDNAKAVPPSNGKYPQRYPFGGGIVMDDETYHTEAIENEIKAQKLIGLTLTDNMRLMSPVLAEKYKDDLTRPFAMAEFIFNANDGCLCSPDQAKMEAVLAKRFDAMKKNGTFEKCTTVGIMDEPAFGVSAIMDCKSKTEKCSERFIKYLKSNDVTPSELNLATLDDAKLSRNPDDGAIFYWTVKYRNHVLANYSKTATDTVKKLAPHMRTTFNIATELVSNGNMVQFGVDWFHIFNTNSLTEGETEDWSNLSPTYQVCGYIMDVMRGATRRTNAPFTMLTILGGRSEEEIAAKTFSEIARGANGITFFRYGPSYTGASDSTSHIPAIHRGIAAATFPTGAVEDTFVDGKTARGDAAMLLSVTSDIYQILNFANPYGRERMWLHLLLSHTGVRLDILAEEDIADELANYKFLFVTDRNIRKEYLQALENWIKSGGTLIMTAGALEADEYNKPLNFASSSGLVREKADISAMTIKDPKNSFGTLENLELANGKQSFTGGKVFLKNDDSSNAATILDYGKGKIVFMGFMPGLSYIRSGKPAENKRFHSDMTFPEAGRKIMEKVIAQSNMPRKVRTDNPLVEALFTEGAKGGNDVITLVNWSGKNPDVAITLAGDTKYTLKGYYPGKIEDATLEFDKAKSQTVIKVKNLAVGAHIELKR